MIDRPNRVATLQLIDAQVRIDITQRNECACAGNRVIQRFEQFGALHHSQLFAHIGHRRFALELAEAHGDAGICQHVVRVEQGLLHHAKHAEASRYRPVAKKAGRCK